MTLKITEVEVKHHLSAFEMRVVRYYITQHILRDIDRVQDSHEDQEF